MVDNLSHMLNPCPMNTKNRPLVTEDLVWIWKTIGRRSRIQEIANHFRRIYAIFLKSIKNNRKMSTCNQLELECLGSWSKCQKISLDTVFHVGEFSWNFLKQNHRDQIASSPLELSALCRTRHAKATLHSVGFLVLHQGLAYLHTSKLWERERERDYHTGAYLLLSNIKP